MEIRAGDRILGPKGKPVLVSEVFDSRREMKAAGYRKNIHFPSREWLVMEMYVTEKIRLYAACRRKGIFL